MDLLARTEHQRMTDSRKQQAGSQRRARRQVRHGAYGKAVSSLTTSVASFSSAASRRHAETLLPSSQAPDALATTGAGHGQGELSQPLDGADGTLRSQEENPLHGVRFSALTAPGPSGMRAEHAREMLAVRRRAL
eukprot:9031138-Karenia_brevis.AAC.1